MDEIELEEEGLADVLMDDNATAKLPRMSGSVMVLMMLLDSSAMRGHFLHHLYVYSSRTSTLPSHATGPGTSFKRPVTNSGTSQGIR